MRNDGPPPRRVTHEKQLRVGSGFFGRLLAVIVGAVVLVGAAMLSLILLAVLFGVGTIVAGYIWWKIRELHGQPRAFSDDGQIVDVEVTHKDSRVGDSRRR